MVILQEVPGGGNHFEPPFFAYILLATILSTFSTSIGYVLVGTKALGFTTHAIYRWNHSISKNDGAHLVLRLMEEILERKRCEKPIPSTDFKSTKPHTRLFVEEKHF